MTAIVGIESRGRVYLAGDSAITAGDGQRRTGGPKVRRSGRIVLGVAGGAIEWVVAMATTLPDYDDSEPVAWCRSVLAPVLLEACRAVELRKPRLELLVGVGGVLVVLDGLRARDVAHTWSDGHGAIGDGGELALGSLWATRGQRPRERLTAALEAAAHYCWSVAPPWVVVVG